MTMTLLRPGSRGPEVRQLQEALNTRLTPPPRLAPDGDYGHQTRQAVLRFQAQEWLVEDGDAGPCTQNALMGTEAYPPILHSVAFIAQPTPSTCWAASTAMLTRSTVPAVIARTPPELILADGSLANYSEGNWMPGTLAFAQAHHLHFYPPASWLPSALAGMLQSGPLMLDMLWNADEYTQGLGSSGHMILVVGMRGDNAPDGHGTTLRIHDPWPPNRGRRYSVGYFSWMQQVLTRTYRGFQR